MMWIIYEISHIWTAVVDESEEWSTRRTGVAEDTGSSPVEALIFQASSFQLLKLEN